MRLLVPALVSLLGAAPALAEVPRPVAQALRGFAGKLDPGTVEAWTASLGRVDYMPYDAVEIAAVSSDGTHLTVALRKSGSLVRRAALALDEDATPGEDAYEYALEEVTAYDRFTLKLVAHAEGDTVPAAEVYAERQYPLAPLYDARAKATYRAAPPSR